MSKPKVNEIEKFRLSIFGDNLSPEVKKAFDRRARALVRKATFDGPSMSDEEYKKTFGFNP